MPLPRQRSCLAKWKACIELYQFDSWLCFLDALRLSASVQDEWRAALRVLDAASHS
jgi:hypothetical protein